MLVRVPAASRARSSGCQSSVTRASWRAARVAPTTRISARAAHAHDGYAVRRRPSRGGVPGVLRPGRLGARRGRRGLPIRPGAAGACSPDALHALAGTRAARGGHRARPGRGARAVRCAPGGTRAGARAHRRLGDRSRREPGVDSPRGRVPDAGEPGRQGSSVAKRCSCRRPCSGSSPAARRSCSAATVSRTIFRWRGLQRDPPVRIYDGPSETHRWAIARRASRAPASTAIRPGDQPPRAGRPGRLPRRAGNRIQAGPRVADRRGIVEPHVPR